MKITQMSSWTPTPEQQSAYDAAAENERRLADEWSAAFSARPFDKDAEADSWRRYQQAIKETNEAGRRK